MTTSVRIPEPVQHSQWQDSFAEKVVWLGQQNIKGASIQLNPPDLGPLNITIKMDQQQASIMFVSSHAAVREAVEEALPRLREMFDEGGVRLGDVDISERSQHDNNRRQALAGDEEHHQAEGQSEIVEQQSDEATDIVRKTGLVDQYV